MLEFLCPNGHRIRCGEDQAGKPAKCPRCGVKFLIPPTSDTSLSSASVTDTAVARDLSASSLTGLSSAIGSKNGGGSSVAVKDRPIEFLCPNGHQLKVPPTQQGKSGKCPKCGATFRIPGGSVSPDDSLTADLSSLSSTGLSSLFDSETPGGAKDKSSPSNAASKSSIGSLTTLGKRRKDPMHETSEEDEEEKNPPADALAAAFPKLWMEKVAGATLEIELSNGDIIEPEDFLAKPSRFTHAFFVVRCKDGVILQVVKWDSVFRVRLRGLKEIPQDFVDRKND